MDNKNVGWLIVGISVLIIGIIFLFNNAMRSIVESGCTMDHLNGLCPAYNTITQQTYLSLAIVGVLLIIGLVIMFSKPQEKVIIKKVKEKNSGIRIDDSSLSVDERKVLTIIREKRGVFQSELVEIMGVDKVKITRILDSLENRGFIERKRRGLNNIVVIK